MKKCKFCGAAADINDTRCFACGANAFVYVCENCANEFEDGMYCPRCGVRRDSREKQCPRCGNRYYTNACPNCGYTDMDRTPYQQPFQPQYQPPVERPPVIGEYPRAGERVEPAPNKKSKLVAIILCLFLGYFGAHKFYEGKILMGVVYFFTGGLFFVGWIFDLIVLLFRSSDSFG